LSLFIARYGDFRYTWLKSPTISTLDFEVESRPSWLELSNRHDDAIEYQYSRSHKSSSRARFPIFIKSSNLVLVSMAQGSLLTSFLGALQACVSVLLTLGYGVLTRHFGLIQTSSIHDVSGLGVKVFLPALILVHLGEQLKLDNAMNYLPVLGKDLATQFYSGMRFI
jgi:hypothetical protein